MRFINREDIEAPKILFSKAVDNIKNDIKQYLNSDDFRKVDITSSARKIIPLVKDDLARLFKNKCAYCETILDKRTASIDNFRPLNSAERFDGEVDNKYYTWLAIEWENLYYVCRDCNIVKANFFPVEYKGTLGADISTLREEEKAILLDPCWDKPQEHLSISLDGKLVALSEKGQYSIKVYNLNRNTLVKERASVIHDFENIWWKIGSNIEHKFPYPSTEEGVAYDLGKLLNPRSKYSGSVILLINSLLTSHSKYRGRIVNFEKINILSVLKDLQSSGPKNLKTIINKDSWGEVQESETLHMPYYIRNIKIYNFKGIGNFSLSFPNMQDTRASCKALIGANTAGKTSILQAIALGILGYEKAHEIYSDARKCLSDTNQEGSIEIEFWNEDNKNIIKFNRSSKFFTGKTPISALLMGYGAHRLAAKKELSEIKRQDNYRLLTLFNERELINGPIGLENRHNDYHEDIARTIANILKNENIDIRFNAWDGLIIEHNGEAHKLENFSSGYQSIISFVTDIMDVLYTRTNKMEGAKGIVIVDELDAHLHPEWKLKIVSALRDTFPYVQFIFSTHDPLILRGVDHEEVSVLSRDKNGTILTTNKVPSIMDGLGVDQMLTSIFGLQSTMKPELEREFAEYYYLLSQSNLPLKDSQRLNELKEYLANYNILGSTERERLMYKLIDKELSQRTGKKQYNEWSKDSVDKMTTKILEKMDAHIND